MTFTESRKVPKAKLITWVGLCLIPQSDSRHLFSSMSRGSNKRGHCTLRLHNDFTDHLADTTAKVIAKDLSCIFRRNLSKGCVKVEIHCGLPVGCNRRMKVVFRKATSSPSGDHFLTFNNYWDASYFVFPNAPLIEIDNYLLG